MLGRGDWVWVDSDIGVPIGAQVKVTPSGQRLLVNDDGKEQSLDTELEASLQIMHPTSVECVDDMIQLGDLTEASLLRNLQLRHRRDIIYTYIGSVLVAVNPYQDFPIYSPEKVKLYHSRHLGELPPHIFGLAETCYTNMRSHRQNQCCIISGESGAGKTESTKLILQYLAAVSGELSQQQIEQQILESNPILEAFGNAKTIRNDNSSRFGKYLEIFFNQNGMIEGARVEQYLLEKSRVCHQAMEERNYHIFYSMLAGVTAEEKAILSLGKAEEYRFLTKGGCISCEGRDDVKDYRSILSAMDLFFSKAERLDILKLLAATLHLGNVSFEGNMQNNLETSGVSRSEHFRIAAALLGVHKSSLATSLTHRSLMTKTESVTKPLSTEQACNCRDALVKAIYNKLFIWIVGKINSVISKQLTDSPNSSFMSIGLLDIFGFENFNTNSFEQLCINFANEKLQQFFVSHIFKLEQEEYLKEAVHWNNIKFSDNKGILELLAGKPCNLLALIDEESHFPKGTDSTLLQKMNQHHSKNKIYIASKHEQETVFGVKHFAGVVCYDSKGFLEKNRDAISFDLIQMVDVSTHEILHQMFKSESPTNGLKTSINRRITMTPKNSLRVQADSSKQVPTLSGQFRQSLDSLMKTLSACHPFFIRCFKPNNRKRPKVFDRELCTRQLRYSGMLDTIRIRKLGFPIRHTFEEFLRRYRVLLNPNDCDPKTKSPASCCKAICQSVIQNKAVWKQGKTKIFLKEAQDAVLERLREEKLSVVALVIQRVMRGYRDRKSFLQKRRAAVVLQRNWRAYKERQRLEHMRKLEAEAKRRQVAAIIIQSQIRGYRARKDWRQKREAVILLQAYTRGMLVRRKMKNKSVPISPEEENQDLIALDLQRRLIEIAESQQLYDEIETARREEESLYDVELRVMESSKPDNDDYDHYDDRMSEFSFYKFSLQHFQGFVSHTHISQRLRQPLLKHDDEGDALACLTVWWIILRFMEDIPEPRSVGTAHQSQPMSQNLPHRQGRKLINVVGFDQKILSKNNRKIESRNRRISTFSEEPEDLTEDKDILIGEGPTLDRPLSSLEKLHIIVGYALSRPNIRDEIYCQICKQLVKNRNARSRMQGWILLSVCLGIFLPTDVFMKYLETFVHKGPEGYGEYCTKRLHRLKANGERKELPCWIELEAAKSKKPIDASVALIDGRSISLNLDSVSTSAEVCQAVADKINLRDTYGFSLFITLNHKTWSLGSCGRHVLDAVAQCEQEERSQGRKEKGTPWRLSIRKELFTPWHDCSVDPISTDLIYKQVVKGGKSEEYVWEKEDEYVQLAAMHYYIHFGSANDKDNMQKVVEECIPIRLIENKSMSKWLQLISAAHLQGPHVSRSPSRESVKGELVDRAHQKWPLYFSRFYEAALKSGPPLPKIKFVVAVNWTGVLFMDGRDKKLREFPYIEIKDANIESDSHLTAQSVSLSTVRGNFVLKCAEAEDMEALVVKYLDGLRQRSVYALAQEDASKPGDLTFLVCKQGDLLLVEKDRGLSADYSMFRATNQRTRSSGLVLKDVLQFLPTLSRPSEETLELLNSGQKKKLPTHRSTPSDGIVVPVTLKEFARENFRQPTNIGRQGALRLEKLWAFSKEPLKQPLMMSLVRNSNLSNLACNAFTAILKYMGDYAIKHARHSVELTDQIFGPATQHDALRDEIYCQIMRQMTNNPVGLSMERGWQLMWLCSGLFPPSQRLMTHAQSFLESRPRDPLAAGCLQRMQEMQSKEPRKFPPHPVEVDAIQQNSTHIFHKVHFPDKTHNLFEVTSTITIKELRRSIASKLNLSSAEGYGLYVKTQRMQPTNMGEEEYFFDSVRKATESQKKTKKLKEGSQANMLYLVLMKRKLWFNVNPGKDLVADLTFHFPQELSKYLRGFHNCTKLDMTDLGGLLFRAVVDSDRTRFDEIPRMLKDLIPADQIKIMPAEDWKKHIIYSYNEHSGITVQEAKIDFLRAISSWPMFGCTFFEVKPTSEPSMPSTVWLVINKQGVSITNPKTKEVIVTHPFSRIADFHHKRDSFQMNINTFMKSNSFVCETSDGKTMEDLLRSYISMYEQQIQAFRPRNDMFF